MKSKRLTLLATVLMAFGPAAMASAMEAPPLSDDQRQQVLDSIERYVQTDAAIKGTFLIVDPRSLKPLVLTFDHVHSTVKPAGDGYLACVDFRDASGRLYDVDVVVTLDGASPEVQTVRLHKVEGVAITADQK
jgi:hypothetical protein